MKIMKDDLVDIGQSIDIDNYGDKPFTIFIEPWCLEFTVSPRDKYSIMGIGPKRGRFSIDHTDTDLIICAWPGSTIKINKNGVEIENDLPRVPPIPGWEDLLDLDRFKK